MAVKKIILVHAPIQEAQLMCLLLTTQKVMQQKNVQTIMLKTLGTWLGMKQVAPSNKLQKTHY